MKVTIDPIDVDSITVEISGVPLRLSIDVNDCLRIESQKDYLGAAVLASNTVLVSYLSPPPKKKVRK